MVDIGKWFYSTWWSVIISEIFTQIGCGFCTSPITLKGDLYKLLVWTNLQISKIFGTCPLTVKFVKCAFCISTKRYCSHMHCRTHQHDCLSLSWEILGYVWFQLTSVSAWSARKRKYFQKINSETVKVAVSIQTAIYSSQVKTVPVKRLLPTYWMVYELELNNYNFLGRHVYIILTVLPLSFSGWCNSWRSYSSQKQYGLNSAYINVFYKLTVYIHAKKENWQCLCNYSHICYSWCFRLKPPLVFMSTLQQNVRCDVGDAVIHRIRNKNNIQKTAKESCEVWHACPRQKPSPILLKC